MTCALTTPRPTPPFTPPKTIMSAPEPPTTPQLEHPPPLDALDHANRPQSWTPVLTEPYPHLPSTFLNALDQMFSHPEHNTSWILRSDTLSDSLLPSPPSAEPTTAPRAISLPFFATTRTLVRRFIPRNPQRDEPAEQTCHFLTSTALDGEIRELVVYVNHCDSAAGTPYYLPKVAGVGWLLAPAVTGGGYAASLLYLASEALENSPGLRSQEFQPATLVAIPRNCLGLPAAV